jgi:hypothetical protein
MWPLDANLDVHLLTPLEEACVRAGFTCLLTQDRLFAESAALALRQFPEFAVVLVRLPQRPWRQYCEAFRGRWAQGPIRSAAGRVVGWP